MIKIIKNHIILLLFSINSVSLMAFPPAPHHTFTGLVRDEMGRPLEGEKVEVLFETSSGSLIKSRVEHRAPGVNYELRVPMDSGATGDLYNVAAMMSSMTFKIRVKVDNKFYLPIELLGDFSRIGKPGEVTRMNLTLGEDADGDGLPDAWERSLLTNGKTISDIKPGDDIDGDGMSNLDEYISGNYAFDKNDGFRLDIKGNTEDGVVLEFVGLRGRSYTLHGTSDLNSWSQLPFSVSGSEDIVNSLRPDNVQNYKISVSKESFGTSIKFFKLMVQ